ncbi:hypothetical protein [Methylomonas rhizoryzae]|uniref:hypothetical protein n=1 Tax=Methylomonas rhizoryzae TaxID=2608981 RepID=UPI0012321C58|nr:hypothetical protein [Methylomonas rhizoryzae]
MKYIDRLALMLIPLLMFLWLFGTGIWILTGPNIKTCNGTLFDETGIILVTSIVGYRIMFKRGDRFYFYVAYLVPSVIGIILVGGCYLSALIL